MRYWVRIELSRGEAVQWDIPVPGSQDEFAKKVARALSTEFPTTLFRDDPQTVEVEYEIQH